MLEFTENELAAIRSEYCAGATDAQFELFISECKARSLRPGPHLVFQLRNAKVYDPDTKTSRFVKKPYWITTIGALRLIALRTGQYGGSTPPEYIYLDDNGDPTVISQIPLPDKVNRGLPREPWAVRISVKRKDFDEPITSVVRFDSVAATQNKDNSFVLTEMWQKRGDAQNAKCAEADALRKAFPEELGSLYLAEEIKTESEEEHPRQTGVTPASIVPTPVVVPPVNQTPAQGTNTPRPNEQSNAPRTASGIKNQESAVDALSKTVGQEKAQEYSATLPEPKAVAAAKAAVPDLKPASEIPEPKKRGRKPTKPEIPEQGITNEDLEPPKNVPTENPEIKKEAEAFVDSVTNFTPSEAAAQGLPEPPDYSRIPEKGSEELKKFTGRVREFTAKHGMVPADLKQFFLQESGKSDINLLTVRDWETSLKKLDDALAAGTLKQTVKPAPLPEF